MSASPTDRPARRVAERDAPAPRPERGLSSRGAFAPSAAPLAPAALCFALGVVADRFAFPSLSVWLVAASVALAGWLGAWSLRRSRVGAACLLVAWFALGGARHHQTWFLQRADDVSSCATRVPTPAMVEGTVLETVRPSAPRTSNGPKFKDDDEPFARCDVAVDRVRDRDRWRSISGVVRLNIKGQTPSLRAGDRLRIVGKLALPEPATNPGEFDHAARLRAQGITAILAADGPECFTRLSETRDYGLNAALDDLRNSARQALAARLSPDVSGMGQALILGGYESVSRDQIDRFVQTGSIHVLAISGMHVAILAGALFFGVSRGLVPRRFGLAGIGLITLVYCTLVGGETPVVRATVLVLIACGAAWLWQRRAAWNAMFLAALVALFWRPADLFLMGPQLSFLAAGVLVACDLRLSSRPPEDPLDRLLWEARPWWRRAAWTCSLKLAEWLGVSVLVYAATLPLVLWNYHIVSPAAVVLNLALAVPTTLALGFGFATLFFAPWFSGAAALCGGVASASLRAMDSIVAAAHSQPGAYFFSPAPALWWVLGFYVGVAVYLELRPHAWLRRWRWPVVLAWAALGFATAAGARPAERLTCTFLNVGHGLAVVVELPDGRALLYDAGRLGSPDQAARAVAGTLWSQGRRRVHAMIVSHADSDHFNGLPELVEKFAFDVVYLAPSFHRGAKGSARTFLERLAAARVPTRPLVVGDGLSTPDGASVRVLQPPAEGVYGEDNANSLVVAIEYAGRRILLTGDLEEAGLDRLLATPPLACDVLLAPHHGSLNGLPDSLARWARPSYVVVSGDPAKTGDHVANRYRENGSLALTTGEVGAVRVTITAAGLRVETCGPSDDEAAVDDRPAN